MSEQPEMLNAEQSRQIRARQAGRAKVMAVILFALAILFFAITIVKVGIWG
jgi:preprotein translocase subunit SecG